MAKTVQALAPRQEMLRFFFDAMLQGYVSVGPKGTIPELPGSKTKRWISGPYELYDVWFTNSNNDYSCGDTFIWKDGVLVWKMSYQGRYPQQYIDFLKSALKQSYKTSHFCGGRGPVVFQQGQLTYVNQITSLLSDNHCITGREEISDNGGVQGWHTYQVLFLID